MCYWTHIFILCYMIIYFVGLTNSQPDFLNHYCRDNESRSTYESNKNTLLSSLPSNMDSYGFLNASFGQSSDRVNAIVLCRGDVGFDNCRTCVNESTQRLIQVCPNSGSAIGWYPDCMLRFSDYPIFGNLETSPTFLERNENNVPDVVQFNQSLMNLVDRLRNQAVSGGSRRKFAMGSTGGPNLMTIYALLQCTPDLTEQQCSNCLDSAVLDVPNCCNGKRGGRILKPSCDLRFEGYNFYNETRGYEETPASVPQPSPPAMDEISSSTVESSRYKFDTLRSATNNFSDDNKLGQGGFGAVYKGRLLNGREIAVKRLSENSEQGDLEFKNEVLLVMKLHHRNLVRLLGFCLEGTERLLIYEFVPNASLDHFIFDPLKQAYLDWARRYNIIQGIARGLHYLHEDSRLRIIHRDVKASNILLDAEMNPKISDFGMAKLFVLDETQGNTNKIAGTYGYMAPEYAMHGQFSTKSDVYSFGVLILEIISGQRNNCFRHGENVENLLSYAWKNWQDGTNSNIIDPHLRTSSSSVLQDIIRCVQIGVLCVQEKVAKRPTMALVGLMLQNSSLTLPRPSEPAFFIHGSNDPKIPVLSSRVRNS